MSLVRIRVSLPADVLEMVDELVGRRGRNAYVADVIGRQVRSDRARRVFASTRGASAGSSSWGRTPEAVDASLREIRASWERDVANGDGGRS